ncbi:MAG: SDR family oxidoreductase [Armatimonadetes bacterium]|nr:SDR family oxidoreductase [Armatimonadota bacterium]
MNLSGRVAVVTGASGHVGQAVSRALGSHGASLVLISRETAALESLRAELPESAPVIALAGDVTDEASVAAMMERVHAEMGGPHLLLNVVGGYAGGKRLPELDLATWERMLTLNVTSAFLCCKYALPYMLAQDYGRIVNVSSKGALDPSPGSAAYSVSKAAVSALTTALARELRGTNVSVAAVMPGTIDTPPNRQAMPKADPSKWVTPEEVAAVMVMLCAEEAGPMNGAIVPVFGGA